MKVIVGEEGFLKAIGPMRVIVKKDRFNLTSYKDGAKEDKDPPNLNKLLNLPVICV